MIKFEGYHLTVYQNYEKIHLEGFITSRKENQDNVRQVAGALTKEALQLLGDDKYSLFHPLGPGGELKLIHALCGPELSAKQYIDFQASHVYGFVFDIEYLILELGAVISYPLMETVYSGLMEDCVEAVLAKMPRKPCPEEKIKAYFIRNNITDVRVQHSLRRTWQTYYHEIRSDLFANHPTYQGSIIAREAFLERLPDVHKKHRFGGQKAIDMIIEEYEKNTPVEQMGPKYEILIDKPVQITRATSLIELGEKVKERGS